MYYYFCLANFPSWTTVTLHLPFKTILCFSFGRQNLPVSSVESVRIKPDWHHGHLGTGFQKRSSLPVHSLAQFPTATPTTSNQRALSWALEMVLYFCNSSFTRCLPSSPSPHQCFLLLCYFLTHQHRSWNPPHGFTPHVVHHGVPRSYWFSFRFPERAVPVSPPKRSASLHRRGRSKTNLALKSSDRDGPAAYGQAFARPPERDGTI